MFYQINDDIETMIGLKKEFSKSQGTFRQIFKDNRIVVYQVSNKYENGATAIWYEIFKPKVHQPNAYHDDEYEKYPSDEDFGKWAWCCSTPKSVEKILKKCFEDVNPIEIMPNLLWH